MVHKFNNVVAQECSKLNLYDKAQQLSSKYQFSNTNHEQLEEIDHQLTKILTKTNQKHAHYCNSPWSLELHQAFLSHRFWTVSLSQACMHHDYSAALKMIAAQMNKLPDIKGSISGNLRKAQQDI